MNQLDPSTAINSNYSRSDCKEYLSYARCMKTAYDKGSVKDLENCPQLSMKQFNQCFPIDPKLATMTIHGGPEVTGMAFARLVQEGNYPNPN